MIKFSPWRVLVFICILISFLFTSPITNAAPQKEYWNRWVAFNPLSVKEIHYPAWRTFLEKYLVIQDKQIYVQYKKVSKEDQRLLANEIKQLSQVKLSDYKRDQQLAYWINLYNMETVNLVLQHPGIKSITEIKSGVFSHGPWDEKLLIVDGIKLSLNDIEHRILRGIWNDPRIHAAVNCASISCPNLQETPFVAKHIYVQLNQAFGQFVNSPKGLEIKNNSIYLSQIFSWYGEDFGDKKQMREFIASYASDKKKQELLLDQNNKLSFQTYNWQLNAAPLLN